MRVLGSGVLGSGVLGSGVLGLRVLGIETSTSRGSVALAQGERIVARAAHDEPERQAERMTELLDRVLAESGWNKRDLERIAVGVGPGAFTGLRIGIAWAEGLGLALGLDVVGVGSLAAVAAARPMTDDRVRFVVRDARRAECFVAAYDANGTEVVAPRALPRVGLDQAVLGLAAGRPLVVVGESVPGLPHASDPQGGLPDASLVAFLAARLEPRAHPPLPLYVRGPGADPQQLLPSPLLGPRE